MGFRRYTARELRQASAIMPLCMILFCFAVTIEAYPAQAVTPPRTNSLMAALSGGAVLGPDSKPRSEATPQRFITNHQDSHLMRDLSFTHITTSDGLSQNSITTILQDRRGFMWFATRGGLNRYDGNTFVTYRSKADDPQSISSNSIRDLVEDDQGYLWIATYTGGVNKFDPATERFSHYRHDPHNSNSLIADSVNGIARDTRGFLWFGTEASGLDKFNPATGAFTHYLNDSDGQFVGRITKVINGRQGDIWFVGERGLFHLNPQTGQITRPPSAGGNLGADYLYQDEVGNLWMLTYSPIVGLIKYDRKAERLIKYPVGAGAVGLVSSKFLADGQKGFWVPSSLGLYYFDRRTEQLTRVFQHVESNPSSLNDNSVVSVYQDRGGVLWVGTENGGLNVLNFQQAQFGRHVHRPGDPNSLSPGKITAIFRDSDGFLWIGYSPQALDKLDEKTGHVSHYFAGLEDKRATEKGADVNSIYKDARGYLWLGGWGSGLDRFDERTGQYKHFRHNPDDPRSLTTNHVLRIYGDRSGQIWVGHSEGVSRFDPVTEQFANFLPDTNNATKYGKAALAFYQDRSGTLWAARGEGVLSRYDEKTNGFVNYVPDPRDPQKLQGGDIPALLEDKTGTLWLGAEDGLYRFNRQDQTFTRYTESQGLPSSAIQSIQEDKTGKLWLSTKNGISRFDPKTETFKNYGISEGLQGNEFSAACSAQGPDGELFFGGSNGINAFFPERVRDDPYVPPVVISSFRVFNKTVPIGAKSVLRLAIPYVDSVTLPYSDNVFSLEFAALSYTNTQENRYRYKLVPFETGWNEVGSKQRLATYTNLDPGKYVFRVQGSNSDGVWNEEGASLTIIITPPWWSTNWFRALCILSLLGLLWAAYQYRVRQLHREFALNLNARVDERTRIARDLHDTMLQGAHGVLLRFQTVSQLLPERPDEAKETLDSAIRQTADFITEARDDVEGLRKSTVQKNDLAIAINALGEELPTDASGNRPAFRVAVEGTSRDLHPILRDEIYKTAAEALRNAFRHAKARKVEVEIRYDDEQFRLRVRDDGRGIDPAVLSRQGSEGHFGLRGMRERATLIGGELTVWSEVEAGTEVELRVPAKFAYANARRASWLSQKFPGWS